MKRIEYKNNGFKEFLNMWKQFYLKSDILKLKNPDQEKKLETGKLCTQSVVQVPMISIVIPTHNRCHFLKQTLESAFGQTAKNYEVVVVDDGLLTGPVSCYMAYLTTGFVVDLKAKLALRTPEIVE